jgi:preprotein translocase subunit YajC
MAIIFPLVLVAAFYFMILRPQQARVRNHNSLVSSLQVGDEVVTAGGIVGNVVAINERDLLVEVAPKVQLKIVKGAIAQKAPENMPAEATE